MTHKGVDYIIVGLARHSLARVEDIIKKLSSVERGVGLYFSGDHHEMVTKSALEADLLKLQGFRIKIF